MTTQKSDFPALMMIENDSNLPAMHWEMRKPEIILGRDETCDIVIHERQISRQHAIFQQIEGTAYLIQDLDSRNGTWVNGNRLSGSMKLSEGDEINLALKVTLKFIGSGETLPVEQILPQSIPSTGGRTGSLKIDTEARQVFINGVEMNPPLSLPQYRLLELLYLNPGRVCTREEVVETVWPEAMGEGVSEQAIDALVRRLRDRLAEVDQQSQYVVTVRGHGFRLENPS